ncbi:hypothetical protein [Candidatus Rariloculus sp.]|uniref:hypothetical protein n=1 Tax=Candidatus Rariloculus sp. TaxID=3101265 RepID=UPI003D0DD328
MQNTATVKNPRKPEFMGPWWGLYRYQHGRQKRMGAWRQVVKNIRALSVFETLPQARHALLNHPTGHRVYIQQNEVRPAVAQGASLVLKHAKQAAKTTLKYSQFRPMQ